ncbi:hypothetical protein BCS42_16810 [Crenothrix sp. D3]|nr:hypothetical protein BCS42_16810 [Crenothrix sp. D3]
MTNAVNPKRLFFLIFLFVIISVLLPSHVTQAKTIKEREAELHQEKVLIAQKAKQQADAKAARQARAKAEKNRVERQTAKTEKRTARETIQPSSTKITDVTHSFFKINELQFSEFATAIDSSEHLRNISKISPLPTPEQEAELAALQKTKVIEPEMVAIKGDCFLMGSPDTEKKRASDEKQHKVCVEDFKIGKYEVTQAQWKAVMGKNPSYLKGDNLPVESVSYNDVQDFINKLNTQTGKSYRLPTEAEWEYAARAGTTTAFYTGDCINTEQANYDGNYDYNNCGAKTGVNKQTTVTVGSYPANPWGLYDMAGNVFEWMCSAYVDLYDGSETKCSGNSNANTSRVLRGGSWNGFAWDSRSADRYYSTPDIRIHDIGFRVALGQTAS